MHNRISVESSVIAAVAYVATDAALDVEFTSGACYRYGGVPEQVVHDFLAAVSKGVFFNRHIKPRYPCMKLT
jgi:hypothetical protein